MKKLLHIIATPREDESRTLKVTEAFLDALAQKDPEWTIDELNLAKEDLPSLSKKSVSGKYVLLEGKDLYGSLKEEWVEIVEHIERFLSSEAYLISTPMWNFSVPYMLKHYIDLIIQPKYLFRYTEKGIEGLVKGKKMMVIASRGGQYTTDETRPNDFQEPYLRTIFGFVGITDISFVIAQPMDMGSELENKKVQEAIEQAKKAALNF
jgi:FMN-dependent NADH-azoreductase